MKAGVGLQIKSGKNKRDLGMGGAKDKKRGRRLFKVSVTGLGPDYIIPGPWPELTPLALWFRQEPPFITVNSGVRPS